MAEENQFFRPVRDFCQRKVMTCGADDALVEAVMTMRERNISSMVVLRNGMPDGIFTDRDYARKLAHKGMDSADTPLADVMTAKLYVVSPRQTVQECMGIMTQAKIRHLPVVSDGAVQGLVSIGDLVNATMAEQEFLISQLGSYISGDLA